jgi:2-(1,2-epoxy-1,2-dihydrophenyl)acetyl-CoA isomerase
MTNYPSVDGVIVRIEGPVLWLVIDRPRTRNALTAPMMDALISHIEAAGQDEEIRVIVLRGAGDDFCAGADLVARNEPTGIRPRVGSIQRRLPTQAHRLIPAVLATQVPVVTVVHGWAAGIGFHLALASDFCVASTSAIFWEPFSARGFTPDSGGSWLLPRMAGIARARALLILGQELTGAQALEWGLIHAAGPPNALEEVAAQLIAQLAAGPTVATGLTKWLLHAGSGLDLEHHLANEAFAMELSSRSDDFREGLAAFQERRAPDFRGR